VNVPDTENLAKIAARLGYKLDELLSYLAGKPVPEPLDLAQILKQTRHAMSQVAMIAQAAAERFAVFAQSGMKQQQAEFPSASLGNCQSLIFINFVKIETEIVPGLSFPLRSPDGKICDSPLSGAKFPC